jgi:uncharacterized protein YecT (DUF1311 family)
MDIERAAIKMGVVLLMLLADPVAAQQRPDLQARRALANCLSHVKGTGEACIGTVRDACQKGPEAGSEVGNRNCIGLELEAWDERLNDAYKKILVGDLSTQQAQRAGPSGELRTLTGADILRDAQRAWIAFRDKKCDAARLPLEGGTGAMTLEATCLLTETARQALWIEDLARGPSP